MKKQRVGGRIINLQGLIEETQATNFKELYMAARRKENGLTFHGMWKSQKKFAIDSGEP